MADEKRKVSLIITAKDQASAVIRGTSTVIQGIASKIGGAFSLAGKVAVGMNQALELAKKAFGALSSVLGATVGKSLEFRSYWDGAQTDIREFTKALERLQVAAGDVLLPILQSLANSFKPLIESATKWLQTNREIVASTLATWLGNVATLLVSGVAQGTLIVARAWTGWKLIINTVAFAIEKLIAKNLEGFGQIAQGIAKLSRAAGADSLADKVDEVSASLLHQSNVWSIAGDKAAQAVIDDSKALDDLEAKLKTVEAAINKAIGEAAKAAALKAAAPIRALAAEYNAMIATSDEAYASIEESINRALALVKVEKAAKGAAISIRTMGSEYERLATQAEIQDQVNTGLDELRKKYGAAADAAFNLTGSVKGASDTLAENAEKYGEIAKFVENIGSSIASSLASTIEAVASGSTDAARAIGSFVGSVLKNLGTMLVQLGTAALLASALSAIPIFAGLVGPPGVGAAAAVAAIAGGGAIIAVSSAIGLADGGLVRGGTRGRDSVPAMLMPDEYVIPAAQVRANVAAGRAPDDSGSARRGEGGGTTINVAVQSFVPPSRAQLDHAVHQGLEPSLRSNIRAGRLRLRSA